MKSNPYVYPTTPFKNLANKNILDNFVADKTISITDLKKEIEKIKQPQINSQGKTIEEKILNIFLDSSVLFGPREFIEQKREEWKEKFSYFTKNNKPLQFTILGFPFKMPVPLKTNRTMPDMGEVLALCRLKSLADNISAVYSPGVIIHIFTEGGFGPFNGVNKKDWVNYDKFLRQLITKLGWSNDIKVKMLSEMEGKKGFKESFRKRVRENESLLSSKDKEFMKKYQGTVGPIFKIVTSKKYSQETLMDVYNEKLADDKISKEALEIRNDLRGRTDNCIVRYFAYLKTRDDLNFLEKKVPHYLALSVSPKPGRLGIIPVNEICRLLPYHGVPVYNTKNNTWSIEYLIDIRRDKGKYEKVFLKEDWEKKPFFYVKIA